MTRASQLQGTRLPVRLEPDEASMSGMYGFATVPLPGLLAVLHQEGV